MSRIIGKHEKRKAPIVSKGIVSLIGLLIIVAGFILMGMNFDFNREPSHFLKVTPVEKTFALNGADQWNDDHKVTALSPNLALSMTKNIQISPLFQQYYDNQVAAKNLGAPITIAFPISQGWLQFFETGALLAPVKQPIANQDPEDALSRSISSGLKDTTTGIIRLPLLSALFTAGSQVPIGGIGSTLTYVDLREAATPDLMQPAPNDTHPLTSSTASGQGFFIKGGTRAGKAVGHVIPTILWNYINRADISPAGWQTDFGLPLTKALAFTIMRNGSKHHLLVQAFARTGLIFDQDSSDPSEQGAIQQLATGVDYLNSIGLPTISMVKQQTIWSQGTASLFSIPTNNNVLAHIGQNFPLTLLGETSWSANMLWYHVQWSSPKNITQGWIASSDVSFTSPGNVPAWASFDILSSDLASYLVNSGSNASAVVYDVTRQRYYTYNNNTQFIVASSMKVPIMLTFLDATEQQGREPDDHEMDLLTTMIENSNNDAASDLYYNYINGADGISNYFQKIGISGLLSNATAWGYSMITPQAMVDLLTNLYNGKILTERDRSLVFDLMKHVELDQQIGVGDTAPQNAVVALKDGWVTDDNDLWAMNTSGIVMVDNETYIISVYTQNQQTLEDGQAIAQQVCRTVAAALT